MEEKNLRSYIDSMPSIIETVQEDITICVIDLKTNIVLASVDGKTLESPFKAGTETEDAMGAFAKVKKEKKQMVSMVPEALFGFPVKGILTPVINEEGEVVAIVSVSKSMAVETQIEESTSSLFNSMEQLNAGIEEIASSSQQLSSFIKGIVEFTGQTQDKIKEIDSIIQVIKNISSQSNLLALNATIEAARAGEAGRGFSVVANEMGKLSTLSKESAEKVAKSLLEMKEAIETIGEQIGKISITSESQAAATEEIAATADEVVGTAKKLSDITKITSFEEAMHGTSR
ncbi:MAG: methyl-accepting chemotaxis protein [Clostridiales bacterium]|jgi:prefoldin subunit 5|nr:methyl-accepting chemotaxis protein [Eubacteriales bacterium]MDH7566325.1 methyl-accepting chemotaxis protein [Clostridiales bacterium]